MFYYSCLRREPIEIYPFPNKRVWKSIARFLFLSKDSGIETAGGLQKDFFNAD